MAWLTGIDASKKFFKALLRDVQNISILCIINPINLELFRWLSQLPYIDFGGGSAALMAGYDCSWTAGKGLEYIVWCGCNRIEEMAVNALEKVQLH